jgi:hypothetical protein
MRFGSPVDELCQLAGPLKNPDEAVNRHQVVDHGFPWADGIFAPGGCIQDLVKAVHTGHPIRPAAKSGQNQQRECIGLGDRLADQDGHVDDRDGITEPHFG